MERDRSRREEERQPNAPRRDEAATPEAAGDKRRGAGDEQRARDDVADEPVVEARERAEGEPPEDEGGRAVADEPGEMPDSGLDGTVGRRAPEPQMPSGVDPVKGLNAGAPDR